MFFSSASNKLRSMCQSATLSFTLPQNNQSFLPGKISLRKAEYICKGDFDSERRRQRDKKPRPEKAAATCKLDRAVLENWKQTVAELQEL